MGYYTHISGEMRIEPALQSWPPAYDDEDASYFRLTSEPGNETVAVVNGALTVVQSSGGFTTVELMFEESVKAYDFDERVGDLAKLAASQGCKLSGHFDGDGEESIDFWRLNAKDNVLTKEEGEVTFPSEQFDPVRAIGKSGHGKVIPRADGTAEHCGGVDGGCTVCNNELVQLRKLLQ